MNKMPDAGKIADAFHHNAFEYDQHVLVQKRVVAQLARSVELHSEMAPEYILDVGTGTGTLLERLHSCYPAARLSGVDIAYNMCLRARQKLGADCNVVNGDAQYLPFATGIFDLVVSASALQWVSDLSAALHEMQRVVRPGGNISLAFFCDGTLGELRHCYCDAVNLGNASVLRSTSRLHDFWKVDDVKAIVSEMDFERFVISVESEVDWYDDMYSLLRSIKDIGAGTVSGGSLSSGLGWRGVLQETSRLYQERYGHNGRIPVTYKVIYLSARAKLK